MKQFFIHTFGCQMNGYDSDRLAQVLYARGWMQAPTPDEADLLLVNTCTVRQLAEHKALSMIGRWNKLKQGHPDLKIGMAGCLAQHLGADAFKKAPGLDFIIGPRAVTSLPALIEETSSGKKGIRLGVEAFGDGGGAILPSPNVSAYVAVMEGCDQFCAYCAVPRARGREVSRPPEAILSEIKRRLEQGQKEIILLGQNITRYGRDLNPSMTLAELLHQVAALEDLQRLRFLTGHPQSFGQDLIEAMAALKVVCPALHLPLQSGSDRILKAMNRGYTMEHYRRLVERIRKTLPDMALSTDIIVGFPGEEDRDFEQTLQAVAEVGYDMAYCFKFSPRQGTAAAVMKAQVPQAVKEQRLNRLLQLVNQQMMTGKKNQLHRILPVLVERMDDKNGRRCQGRSHTNHIVYFRGTEELIGREVNVRIVEAGNFSLIGELSDRR